MYMLASNILLRPCLDTLNNLMQHWSVNSIQNHSMKETKLTHTLMRCFVIQMRILSQDQRAWHSLCHSTACQSYLGYRERVHHKFCLLRRHPLMAKNHFSIPTPEIGHSLATKYIVTFIYSTDVYAQFYKRCQQIICWTFFIHKCMVWCGIITSYAENFMCGFHSSSTKRRSTLKHRQGIVAIFRSQSLMLPHYQATMLNVHRV